MNDLRIAAQQALNALENALDAQSNPMRKDFPTIHDFGQMRRAHIALRAALAQQEQMQEPVEIKPPNPEGATQCIVRWLAETPAGWIGAWDREALERLERFTAHPPRREWRGLTPDAVFASDEIMAANASLGLRIHQLMDLVRAIEQALKERNNG